MQPPKLRIQAARYKRNIATGVRELGRSGGKLLMLSLKMWTESDKILWICYVFQGGLEQKQHHWHQKHQQKQRQEQEQE